MLMQSIKTIRLWTAGIAVSVLFFGAPYHSYLLIALCASMAALNLYSLSGTMNAAKSKLARVAYALDLIAGVLLLFLFCAMVMSYGEFFPKGAGLNLSIVGALLGFFVLGFSSDHHYCRQLHFELYGC